MPDTLIPMQGFPSAWITLRTSGMMLGGQEKDEWITTSVDIYIHYVNQLFAGPRIKHQSRVIRLFERCRYLFTIDGQPSVTTILTFEAINIGTLVYAARMKIESRKSVPSVSMTLF